MYGMAKSNGGFRIFDAYTRDRSTPRSDAFYGGQDDIIAAVGEEKDGWTYLKWRRFADTGKEFCCEAEQKKRLSFSFFFFFFFEKGRSKTRKAEKKEGEFLREKLLQNLPLQNKFHKICSTGTSGTLSPHRQGLIEILA